MLFILFACLEQIEQQYQNPLAIDNDGDGYTEFQGDMNDNDPTVYNGSDYIHKDDCPQAIVTLDPTVLEVVCPTLPQINLSCPPIPDLSCPPPIVDVECPQQEIIINQMPTDMTEINKAFHEIGSALQNLAIATDSIGTERKQFMAFGGNAYHNDVLFTNNDSEGRDFIVTAINYRGEHNHSLYLQKQDGSRIQPLGQYVNNSVSYGGFPDNATKNGNLTMPIAVGESIVANLSGNQYHNIEYYFQGYYSDYQ